MRSGVFKFKKFEVTHGKGSMKVGVDAVLIGAWTSGEGHKILDVGCGCGVISLILAQRFPNSEIHAVDIDENSVKETEENFKKSPWSSRLNCRLKEFPKDLIFSKERYDLIISNPPYFNSGIKIPHTSREKARHQDTLSIFSLISFSDKILTEKGILSFICPFSDFKRIKEKVKDSNFFIKRICKIRDNQESDFKRIMVELWKKQNEKFQVDVEELTMFEGERKQNIPTVEYKNLCSDLYLKF